MTWYSQKGNSNDISLSTRVRLARNLKGYPFPVKLDRKSGEEIIEKVWAAFENFPEKDSLRLIKMGDISPTERIALAERHLISMEMAKSDFPSAVILDSDEDISVMINEEDHLRIQAFAPGFDIDKAYNIANKLDIFLSENLEFSFHERFGFLTACPTNVGTGLRASVMLHLPALTATKNLNNILSWSGKLGLTLRGLFGEGTQGAGRIYQLSNQITLGPSEEDILTRLKSAASELMNQERLLQAKMFEAKRVQITDSCMRAYGILSNAYTLSSNEMMTLISDVHLGINLGIIKNVTQESLTSSIFLTMPANIAVKTGNVNSPIMRDIKRAEFIKNTITKE